MENGKVQDSCCVAFSNCLLSLETFLLLKYANDSGFCGSLSNVMHESSITSRTICQNGINTIGCWHPHASIVSPMV